MKKPARSRGRKVLVALGVLVLAGATTVLAIQRGPPAPSVTPAVRPTSQAVRPAAPPACPAPLPAPAPVHFPTPFDARPVRPFDALDLTQLDSRRIELVAMGLGAYEDRDRQHWGAQPRFEAALSTWYADGRPHELAELARFADRDGFRCDVGFVMKLLRIRAAAALIVVRLEQLSSGGDRAAHRWLTAAALAYLRDLRRGILFGPSDYNAPLCLPLETMLFRHLRAHAVRRIKSADEAAEYLDILRRDAAEEVRIPSIVPALTAVSDPERTIRGQFNERMLRNRWMRDGTEVLLRVVLHRRLRDDWPASILKLENPDLAAVPRQPGNGERFEYRRTPGGFEMPAAGGFPAGTEPLWPPLR